MVRDSVAMTAMMADLVLNQYFHGRGNAMVATEIIMVRKYFDGRFFGL